MGIRGLHTHLQSHGTHHAFTCTDRPTPVVIDGPALAYSLWRQERLREGEYRKYKLVLTDYLKHLQDTAGFSILLVYFDGHLPPHKRGIRQARAKANLERVKRNRGSLIHSTPPPPFVVPLTQDVLVRLGVPVCVAPGEEADVACARAVFEAAQSSGRDCYLISLDSDFHCFNLGQHGFYLPLDTLTVSESSVTGTLYQFKQTQARVGVDLLQLAALMGAEGAEDMNPRAAPESVNLIKKGLLRSVVAEEELLRVRKQFSVSSRDKDGDSASDVEPFYGRLAEAMESGEIWLPQLLEDCSQTAAWNAGFNYRILAYSSLLEGDRLPTKDGIIEWIRRADVVSGRPIEIPGSARDIVRPSKPVDKISAFVECLKTLINVYLDLGKGITQIEYNGLIVMVLGTYPGEIEETSLRILHLSARWQAIVFSYTLLCQASGCFTYPLLSDLYDLQTLLKACELLESGHSLTTLCKGREKNVDFIRAEVPWTSAKTNRKRKMKS